MCYMMLIPAALSVVAVLGLHSAACGMHVAAVDAMRNPVSRSNYQGVFYRYCKIISAPLRALGQ